VISDIARSGRYARQPTGYRAFIPADLPPGSPIVLDATLVTLLSEADQAIGRLDGAIGRWSDPHLGRSHAPGSARGYGGLDFADVLSVEAMIADLQQ